MIWRNLEKNKDLLQQAAKSKAFVLFDTETTGLGSDSQIIEFAGFKCFFKDGAFVPYDICHLYIKPDKPVPPETTEVHGITDEFLSDKMDERQAFPVISGFLGEAPVLGAYNSAFDIKMLTGLYKRCGREFHAGLDVDILKIIRDIFCEQKMKDHKLETIANTYGVDEGIEFHSAKDDVTVLLRVTNAAIKDIRDACEKGSPDKIPVQVYRLNYYEGYRGNSRLYVITSSGPIYYDFKNDKWMANDSSLDLSTIDMAGMEKDVFKKAGVDDYKALKKECDKGTFGTSSGGESK